MANAFTDTDITGTLDVSGQMTVGGGSGDTGATHAANGDITTDGDVTANAFVGDGSGLTSVPAGGPTFGDDVFRVNDDGDATKQIAFQASGITTGTARTITMPDTDVDLADIATNSAKVTNATHTGDVTGDTTLTIAAGAVDTAHLSFTGTADATTFARGDGTWATPAGGGDMTLAGVQTNTGAKSFDDSTLILNGSTSGTTTLKADATAGTTVATFQSTTGTVAYSADIPANTDSLTEGSTNLYKTAAEQTKLGHITVTQAVNLDSLESGSHDAITMSGTPNYITLSGQDIVRGQVDLAADVTGTLPTANIADEAATNAKLAHMTQGTLKGRAAGAGTGDATDLTLLQVLTLLMTPVGVTSSSNSAAWNSDSGMTFSHTLSENTTIAASSGTPFDGQRILYEITQATGPYTLAWNAEFVAGDTFSDTIPAVSTTSGDIDRYAWIYNGTASKWQLLSHATH